MTGDRDGQVASMKAIGNARRQATGLCLTIASRIGVCHFDDARGPRSVSGKCDAFRNVPQFNLPSTLLSIGHAHSSAQAISS